MFAWSKAPTAHKPGAEEYSGATNSIDSGTRLLCPHPGFAAY